MLDTFHQVFSRLQSLEVDSSYPPLVACPAMSDGYLACMTVSSANMLTSSRMRQWDIGASFVEMVIDGPF